ncbi:MAG TPA: ribonuclease P protein component [Myxococcota bacterium]|nr:ribonuclease P protein component [Myxococcota bacterium]
MKPGESSAGFGFPKSARLLLSHDFRRVQGRGRRIRTRHLLVLYTPGRREESRWGLVVSKKVGKAVTRNQVKRWLRESIRHRRRELVGAWDLAVIASPRAADSTFSVLDEEIAEVVKTLSQRAG